MNTVPTRLDERGIHYYDVDLPRDLVAMLRQTVAARGSKVAFVAGTQSTSWSNFGAEVEGLAARLVGSGVRPGERIAVLAENGIPFTTGVFAIWTSGAIAVPLNSRLTPDDLCALLKDSGARLLLVSTRMKQMAVEVVRAGATGVQVEVTDDKGRFLGEVEPSNLPKKTPGTAAPALIMYTSGTTGRPKGVVISHGNALQNSVTCTEVVGRTSDERELVMVPQFNITGLCSQTVPVVHLGATAILLDGFNASSALDAIGAHGVTCTVGAPTMWWRMLEESDAHERTELSKLRLSLFGGAPMPTALLRRMERAMPEASFGNGYGMTETCSMITYVGGKAVLARPDSVGQPLPLTEIRLISPVTGELATPGEIGEIVVRGGQVAENYWTPTGISALTDENGWVATGDAAVLDDGYVVLRDRLKDVIKRGGESIFSFEVEDCLYQHQGILDAAVIGVPDEQYGERVVAYVVAKPAHHLQTDQVRAFCQKSLARFKVPSEIVIGDELPRNPGGKVIKSQLRERFITSIPAPSENVAVLKGEKNEK